MKTIKTLLASLLALGLVSAAQAQTEVLITGSTAFRANTLNAIQNIMSPGYTFGWVGTGAYNGSTWAIIKGTVAATGANVIIKTHFSGSEGGNQTVSGQIPIVFLDNSSATSPPPGTSGLPDPTGTGPMEVPDIGMSDTYQSSSFFFGTYFGHSYPALNAVLTTPGLPTGQIVGVVQFKWCAGKNTPASMTNMTSQLARDLFGAGTAALALWTGLSTDHGTTVFAVGRDFDSGTRLTTFAESGVGAKAVVKQYFPYDSSGNVLNTAGGTIDHFGLTPAGSVNGIPYGPGNGGYSSGGNQSKGMNNTPPANQLCVGYLGTNDADGQISGSGLKELSYNGVTLGLPENSSLIKEGAYTFWGYEHLYYRDSANTTVEGTADTLALQIYNTDAPLPHYVDMQVQRLTDGGTVSQKY